MEAGDPALVALYWSDSGVTDVEVQALGVAVRGNQVLRTVHLWHNEGVTDVGA